MKREKKKVNEIQIKERKFSCVCVSA